MLKIRIAQRYCLGGVDLIVSKNVYQLRPSRSASTHSSRPTPVLEQWT